MSIHFTYFDIGGVLILDYSGTNKWIEMKRALGVTEELDDVFDRVWKKYRSRICLDCDVDTILSDFEQTVGMTFPQNYSMLEDFVNRFDRNESIWPIALRVSERMKVGLLTNMYPRMYQAIQSRGLLPQLPWHTIIDSSTVGFQKPDAKIFEHAEKAAGYAPESLLFVDNNEDNVAMAKTRGWQTFLYDPQNPEESSRQLSLFLDQ